MNLITLPLKYLEVIPQFLNEFSTIDIILISFIFIFLIIWAIINFISLVVHSAGRILTIGHKIITSIAAGTVIANSLPKGTDNDKDKDKDKKKSKESDNKSDQSESTNNNSGTSKSFFLPFILSFLDIPISDTTSRIIELANGVFLLSIVAFTCLFNVFLYSIVFLLIQKASYETKYPRLLWFINFYKTTSLLYIAIEAFIGFSSLLFLIGFSLYAVLSGIN